MAEIYVFSPDDELLTILSEDNGLLEAPMNDLLNDVSDTPFQFIVNAHVQYEQAYYGDNLAQVASSFIGPYNTVNDHVNVSPAQFVLERNRVVFKDRKGDFREFVIAEVDDSDDMEGPITTATCYPAWQYELRKSYIVERRFRDAYPRTALSAALENTRYEGTIEGNFETATTSFYHINSADAIWKLMDVWGGEFKDTVTLNDKGRINGRHITIYARRGHNNGLRLEIDHNIETIERTVISDPITSVYGWGASLEIEDEEGNKTGGHTRYIDFAEIEWKKSNGDPVDKPKGQKWVGDPELLNAYGLNYDGNLHHLFGEFSNQDYEEKDDLLQAAWDYLQENAHPKVNYKVTADIIEGAVDLGDSLQAIDREFARPIEIETRVIGISYDLLDIDGTYEIEFGQSLSLGNIGGEIDDIKREIEENRGKTEEAIRSADGKNTNYYGPNKPDNDSLTEGDLWFEVIEGEYVKTWRYDGESWQIILDMADKEIEELAEEAHERAEEAHERATDSLKNSEEAVNKAQEGFDKAQKAIDESSEARQKAQEGFDMAQENASEIDSFGVRMDDAEGNITKISGTVDGLQTTVKDNEDNIYTLTQTAEGLESRVGEVEKWEIGGRNYVKDSDETKRSNKGFVSYPLYKEPMELLLDEEVSISFDARSLDGNDDIIRVYLRSGYIEDVENIPISDKWERYYSTIFMNSDRMKSEQIAFHTNGFGATSFVGEVRNVKVERGNKATDWSPAPEDTDEKFSAINQTIDSIATRVQDNEGNISSVTQLAEGLQTDIRDNKDNINTITQLAEGNLTKIENAQGDILKISERADSIVSRIENSSGNLLEHTDFDVKDNINDWYRWLSITSGFVQGTVADRKWLTVLIQGAEKGDHPRIRTPYRYHFKKGQTYTVSWLETTYPEGLSVEPYAGIYVNGVVKDNFYNAKQEVVEETETNGQKITVYRYTHTFEFSGEDDDECAIYIGKEVEDPSMLLSFYFREMQLEKGEHRTPYEPNYKDSSSQISQLSDDIDLRVSKGDVINQINISSEDILISGKKLILDGETYVKGSFKVGSANIKDASIGKAQIGDLNGANISSINIYGSYIEGSTFYSGNSNNYTEIKNSKLTARGQFKRTWLGYTTNYNVRTMLQNGYLRFRNDDARHSLYFSEFGISTYVDGEGSDEDENTVNGSSGSILWWDRTHSISDSNPKGITVNSYGGTAALTSTHNHVLMKSKYSAQIESTESNIQLNPYSDDTNRNFKFTKSSNRLDGYILFGDTNETGLRFDGGPSGLVQVVDSDSSTGGSTTIEAGIGRFNVIYRRSSNKYVDLVGETYLRVGQDSSSTNAGRRVASLAIYRRTYDYGSNVYVTSNGTLGRATSASKYKLDIERQRKSDDEQLKHSEKILDLDVKHWYSKSEVETLAKECETNSECSADSFQIKRHVGLVAEDVEKVGLKEHVSYGSDGVEVEGLHYDRLWVHLLPVIKDTRSRVEQLESENELLKARIQALEGAK